MLELKLYDSESLEEVKKAQGGAEELIPQLMDTKDGSSVDNFAY